MKKRNVSRKPIPSLVIYLICIVITGIIGLIIAGTKFFGSEKSDRYSSTVIEFTYDGAAQNLTPSGQKFSINEITSDKILEDALAKAGVSDRYTADAIRNSLVVTGSYPKDVIDRIKDYTSLYDFSASRQVSLNDYYPTIYSIKLYDDFDKNASAGTMNSIVKAIADSYKEHFLSEYVYSFDMSKINSMLVLDNYDYLQKIKILSRQLKVLDQFATDMYAKNSNFKKDGLSFNDISLKCRDISNDALSKLEAAVTINAFTVSNARLKNQYEYEIQLLENELEYKKKNLEELNELIASYKTDDIVFIGSGDSLVKVESNSKQTYEDLIGKKKDISDRIVEINTEINDYKMHLEDLTAAASSATKDKTSADKQIEKIDEMIGELEKSFSELITAYNDSIVSEDAVVTENARHYSAKLLSAGFIVQAIKCAGPLCIIVMLICCIHAAFTEIRKFKKQEA